MRVWTKRIVLFVFAALACLVVAEFLARAFWMQLGVPPTDPGRILYAYYPELKLVDTAKPRPRHGGKYYDVLFLGASALNREWGVVEQALLEQLARRGQDNVRVFNLAVPAHTSRDSMLKYAALKKARFDLVVFYHGINETRANNAPAEIFDEDYNHYSWYEAANMVAPFHGATSLALPYTLHYLYIRLRQALWPDQYVPTAWPRDEWLQFGGNPRSVASFRQNLDRIMELAARRGDRVLPMTFATYIPPDPEWGGGGMSFGLRRAPVSIWGRRVHVLNTLEAQNEVVRDLAAGRADTLFVDQAKLIEGSPRNFNDACHLTIEGSSHFVENLLNVLPPLSGSVSAR